MRPFYSASRSQSLYYCQYPSSTTPVDSSLWHCLIAASLDEVLFVGVGLCHLRARNSFSGRCSERLKSRAVLPTIHIWWRYKPSRQDRHRAYVLLSLHTLYCIHACDCIDLPSRIVLHSLLSRAMKIADASGRAVSVKEIITCLSKMPEAQNQMLRPTAV